MKKILLIEDNEAFSSVLANILSLNNFNVISTDNGKIGVKLAKELQPDLIISDINIPGIDGLMVLNKLRNNLATAKIPIIFLTAEADPDKHRQALQMGANGYLEKTVQLNELLKAITAQLKPNFSS